MSKSTDRREGERTSALVKDLHRVGGDGQSVSDIGVSSEDLLPSVSSRSASSFTVRTWLICLVNSVRSSSLIECVILVLLPLTSTFPPPACCAAKLAGACPTPATNPLSAPPRRTCPADAPAPSRNLAIRSTKSSSSTAPDESIETDLSVSRTWS